MKNQKGQALIEALGFLTLILCGSLFLLAVLYQSALEIAVDDQLESFLICQIQDKATCESDLNRHLSELQVKVLRYNKRNLQNHFFVELEYELPLKRYFSYYTHLKNQNIKHLNSTTIKKRELRFEKNID